MTQRVKTIAEMRALIHSWRQQAGETVGFVPTMGALHRGHIRLLEEAKSKAKRTVVSVFVNPTQFGPHEDFNKYTRQIEKDHALLESNGCDLLFAPDVSEMYPDGFITKIDPGPLATVLEGACRPGHFSGVATVVCKLLMQAMPDFAFFGEKDFQQLLVIRRIVADLDIPVEIVPVATVRDEDGLALSSRNAYLSDGERQKALVLSQTLRSVGGKVTQGEDIVQVLSAGRKAIEDAGFVLDYLELCDTKSLAPLTQLSQDGQKRTARILVAAKIGTTRLIDNMGVV